MGVKSGSIPPAVPRPSPRMSELVHDALRRPLASLRLSVTDRCNLRCRYCMPEDEYVWLPRASILSFEEIARLVGVFAALGAHKVRLTGGEPLLRHDLPTLVDMIARDRRITDLAMTTNGLLLASQAAALRAAGLARVTVSLDTLRPERMLAFAKSARHADVLAGITAARQAGFAKLKLNAVVIRGFNDDELADLIEFARGHDAEVRFIEYMDVGGATRWSRDQVVSRREVLDALTRRYGTIEPVDPNLGDACAPADRFRLADGTTFGIIASTTAPFCRTCDRSRITADGTWFLCLYAGQGIDLREPLRRGATDEQLGTLIRDTWRGRTDRGAEERLGVADRGALYRIESLQADPHREMHTRGG
jgi:cyclic pyranopterin phosphate synthase